MLSEILIPLPLGVKYVGILSTGVLSVEIVHENDLEQRVYIELYRPYDWTVAC
jgi:hypothetical protein